MKGPLDRPEVKLAMLYGHGGDVYSIAEELGIQPDQVLDFSSNCSPLPYPKGLKEFLCDNLDQMHMLPEVDSKSIRYILANRYGLDPDSFLIGNGTTQWIHAIPRLLSPKRALLALPTYADYQDSCLAASVPVSSIGLFPEGNQEQVARLVKALEELEPSQLEHCLIFICNPNNPTGLFIPPDQLLDIIDQKPSSAIWIIDEAYAPFVSRDDSSSLLTRKIPGNVILLRSFSKIYGIPGLRAGCLVNCGAISQTLGARMRPWAVNRMAQLALEFLLKRPSFEDQVREYCSREKASIVEGLSRLRCFKYIDGKCHFAMFHVTPEDYALHLVRELRKRGILIRDCSNFQGLKPGYVRISPRMQADNLRLVLAIKEIIQEDMEH